MLRRAVAPLAARHYGPAAPIPIPTSLRGQYAHLNDLICTLFGIPSARWFQIDGILYQVMGQDVVIHSGTGSGKTLIAAGLYALDEYQDRLTIMVSPLIALQSDMVGKFNANPRTPAIIINSTMKAKELSEALKDILNRKYRIILISPESLLSQRIRDSLLLDPTFKQLVASIVVDEAHCISVWGSGFRKKYGTLHVVRSYLPKAPVIAMSATLSPRVLRDITSKLHMGKSYGFINVGNERPDLSLIVRQCQFPMSSFRDLSFLFKDDLYHPLDIPKTFIFLDNKTQAYHAVEILNSFLPPHLRNLGLIRPFNARHGTKYRLDAMEQFKLGNIRVLVCTDAAGMGCDIRDVDISIQWRVTSLSNLIQRWGRAARAAGFTGIVILFYEPSATNYNPSIPGSSKESAKSASKSGPSTIKKSLKEPLLKGGFRSNVPGAQPELRDDSPYEGTLVMVQTNGCYRKVWTAAFKNEPITPVVECCSAETCSPGLLKKIEPPKRASTSGPTAKKSAKKGLPHLPTRDELLAWRSRTWSSFHSHASWGADGLLRNELVNLLASIGPIDSVATLERYISSQWGWWSRYGSSLADLLIPLKTPFIPRPSKPRTSGKRKPSAREPQDESGAQHAATNPSASSSREPVRPAASVGTSKKARIATANPREPTPPPHPSSVAGGDTLSTLSQAEMSHSWIVPQYRHDSSISAPASPGSHEYTFHASS